MSVELRVVPTDELTIDHDYQRPVVESPVKNIVQNFDPALLGTLEVSERGSNGTTNYAVMDGQQRLTAVRRIGRPTKLRVNVHKGLSTQQEAGLFVRMNKARRPLKVIERFRASLAAGDPGALAIARVVEDTGWTIGSARDVNSIEAIVALERVHHGALGADHLQRTLTTIKKYWDGDRFANSGPFIMAVAYVLGRWDVSDGALERMAVNSPGIYRRRAKARQEGVTGDLAVAMAEELRRTGKLRKKPKAAMGTSPFSSKPATRKT